MKAWTRQGGLWVLLFFCWLPGAFGQSGAHVSGIVITNVGPQAVSDDLVRANIHVKVGDVYVRASVDDDILSLYATGYFLNIQVVEQFQDAGANVVLTYLLEAKPKLTSIKFEGNIKYSDEKLLKKVTSKIGEPVDERKLFSDCQDIQKMYEKAGYPSTKVSYVFNNFDQAAGRSGVTFEIKEGVKIKIVEVDFTGAKAFTEKKLRGVIKTRRHWMFSWLTRGGIFKEDQFEDDKDKLVDFYRGQGYIDFEIQDVKITNPTPQTMVIDFVISEGLPYKVGSVTFPGTNQLFTVAEISAGLKQQHERNRSKLAIGEHGLEADAGMLFTPDALAHDIQSISDFYGSRGYIDAGLGGGMDLRARRIPNTETGTMDLEYYIDAGDQSYIEKIEIKGNSKTKDKVIRRELAVSPGDVFDMVRVRLSKERLEGLGYFEKVDTKIEPTVVPNRKNLIVGVDEKSTGQFTFGAGFNTVDSILGFAQIEQTDFDLFAPPYFTGAGQKFRLRVQLGAERQDYLISFVEPWFLNRKLQLGIDLYHSVLNFQSLDSLYDETRTGARFGLTRALGSDFLIGGVSYNVENIGIVHVNPNAPNTILNEAGNSLLQRFGTSLAYDTRNNTTLPNKGQRTELAETVAVGDRNFFTTELRSSWYFKGFAPGHVLELGGKIRVSERLSSRDVPFYDRSYLGGQYDLRGFDYRGVGPREVTQDGSSYEPIGGDTSWFASAEYSVPIISRLRFAMFYDIGNVSAKPFSFRGFDVIGKTPAVPPPFPVFNSYKAGNTGTYSDNWGLGLRLDLPIGPLRLDYGIPLKHDSFNSGNGKFQFGVGFTRPL